MVDSELGLLMPAYKFIRFVLFVLFASNASFNHTSGLPAAERLIYSPQVRLSLFSFCANARSMA